MGALNAFIQNHLKKITVIQSSKRPIFNKLFFYGENRFFGSLYLLPWTQKGTFQ